MTEQLVCICGRAVRVVRLGRSLLTLGHLTNPRQDHHPVRLASREAAVRALGVEGNQPLRGASDPSASRALVTRRPSPRRRRVTP
jgi:hypothetical protein